MTSAGCVPSPGCSSTWTSCGRTSRSPTLVTGPTNDITNSLAGPVVDVLRRRGLLDAALVDHDDLLGDLQRLLLVVRDEDRRHVDLVVQAAQPGAQLLAHAGVERAERLVEQQHVRLDGERAGERHPLALAAGELGRVALAEVAEADEVQQLLHARAIWSLGRLLTASPKATLSATVMCLKAA